MVNVSQTIDKYFSKNIKTSSENDPLLTAAKNDLKEDHLEEDDIFEMCTSFFMCPHCFTYFEGNNDFLYQHLDTCVE